jgi:hypothetical protein
MSDSTNKLFNFLPNEKLFKNLFNYIEKSNFKNNFFFYVFHYTEIYTLRINHSVGRADNFKLFRISLDNSKLYKDIKLSIEYSKQNDKKFILIIDAAFEAPSYRYTLKKIIDDILVTFNLLPDNVLIYSGACNQFDDPINFSTCWTIATVNLNSNLLKINLNPEKHFISLSRIARQHRILSTIEIFDRNLQDKGIISLGSGYNVDIHDNDLLLTMVPERYKEKFPMYIDAPIINETYHLLWRPDDIIFTNAFVNLVQETSYEYEISPTSWHLPVISEKSMKPFMWWQVPIFLMPHDSLKYIRQFGFDLFDDIVDHSYDFEINPLKRIQLVIDQIDNICNWTIKQCHEYKEKNIYRFNKNFNLFIDFQNNKDIHNFKNFENTLKTMI